MAVDGVLSSFEERLAPLSVGVMFRVTNLFDVQRWKYSRLAVALSTAGLIWGLGSSGMLSPAQGFVYDHFARLSSALIPGTGQVLLVELDEEKRDEDREQLCLRVVELLDEMGARRILFTSSPRDASVDFYVRMRRYRKVIFGRPLLTDPYDPENVRIAAVPKEARDLGVDFALVYVDAGTRGVHRMQRARFAVDGEPHLALEAQALPAERLAEVLGGADRYRVHFLGGVGSLPAIEAARVLEGGLVPELVRGKWVIVGEVSKRLDSGVATPTAAGRLKMSPLEFHGHALNTLLTGRVVRDIGPMLRLTLLLVLAFVSCIVYQWVDALVAGWITLLMVAATLLLIFVLFNYGGVWVPATEICSSQGALLFVALRNKAALSTAWLRALLLSTMSRLQDRYLPTRPGSKAESWALIVNMVNQTLELNRVIFLETERGTTRLKEVQALNCSIDDINERRRDFRRTPYVTAIESRGPLRVENYLKKAYDLEEQYLVPLQFGNELLGFWACGVDPGKAAAVPSFENVLRSYAALISELLHERRQLERHRSWTQRLEAYVTHERSEDVYEQLKTTMEVVEGRLLQIEGLLGDINTATAVYDLFGRGIYINQKMTQLLEDEGLSPRTMTALDLVSALSEYDLGRSRRILRHVLIEMQSLTFPVSLSKKQGSRFVLHLHPLQLGAAEQGGESSKELTGKSILCELVDTTTFTGLFEMKEKLSERLGLQLRNDLASIDLSSSLLSRDELSPDQRRHISQMIHDKVARTMDVLVECQQYLALDSEVESVERFPMSSREIFEKAVAGVEGLLESRGMKIEVDRPRLMSFVLASAENLRTVFSATLKLLVTDATDNSQVTVSVNESEDLVTYRFKNTGFGIPNDLFQKYLYGDASLASEELKTLREGIRWVEAWGGELEAYSEVGVGTQATLRLVKFI